MFEVCGAPMSKVLDGLLQDCLFWLTIYAESLFGELTFDNGDAVRFAGFDLHSRPFDVFLEFTQKAFSAWFCCCDFCHVIHVCPD